ncbi:unnamed protein product, partial [Allacma fusca]
MNAPVIILSVILGLTYRSVVGTGDHGNLGLSNETKFRGISSRWLDELEESYKFGFSRQFRDLKHPNMSTVPNYNHPRRVKGECRNVTFLSIKQKKRIVNKYGWDFFLNSTIHEMLDNPRARLFEYDDLSGEFEDYRFAR